MAGIPVFYRESPGSAGRSVMVGTYPVSDSPAVTCCPRLSDWPPSCTRCVSWICRDREAVGGRSRRWASTGSPTRWRPSWTTVASRQRRMVGNSMGCAVICAFAYRRPGRLERAVLVSPAGGIYNQPLLRAMPPDRSRRTARAGADCCGRGPGLPPVRCSQHRRPLPNAHPLPVLERMLALRVPTWRYSAARPADAGVTRSPRSRRGREPRADGDDREAAHAINSLTRTRQRHPAVHGRSPIQDDPDAPGRPRVRDPRASAAAGR